MSFYWESPVRSVDCQTLPPIPNEIYIHIFDYLSPNDDITHLESRCTLSNLSLVCKFFCALAIPRLFDSLELEAVCHKESTTTRNSTAFCRSLIQKQRLAMTLAQHVKRVEIRSFEEADSPHSLTLNAFLRMYLKSIPLMQNIESLSFYRTLIDKRAITSIVKLQKLRSLSVGPGCTYSLTEDTMRRLTSLKLDELVLEKSNGDLIKHINNARLKRLSIAVTSYQCFMESRQKQPLSLETLCLSTPDSPLGAVSILKSFQQMPLLRNLDISSILFFPEQIQLMEGILSKLKRISLNSSAGFIFKALLQSNWSIEEATIKHPFIPKCYQGHIHEGQREISAALSQHPSKVRILEIPAKVSEITTFCNKFYKLECLSIVIEDGFVPFYLNGNDALASVFGRVLAVQGSLPYLRQLRFVLSITEVNCYDYQVLDLKKQHALVTSTSFESNFPCLEICSFVEGIEWYKDKETSVWKPFLPARSRELVIEILRNFDTLQGYHSYFKTILTL